MGETASSNRCMALLSLLYATLPPATEDVRVTEAIVEAGALLDIRVLGHLIIGRNRFVSLKERGLGFK